MTQTATALAHKLLAEKAESLEELRIYVFEDDAAAHDDELQEQLETEFAGHFDLAKQELTASFGTPLRIGNGDSEWIPLNGVFRFAVWQIAGKFLWCTAAHEDRELPFLLMLGTRPTETA